MTEKVLLKRGVGRWFHWCPGCQMLHPLPDRWAFNGNMQTPTFRPGFKHVRKEDGKVCHYWIEMGWLRFVDDTTMHDVGRRDFVKMPEIPEDYRE
jgi:hypothetical protein